MLGRDKAKLGLGLPPPGAALADSPPGSEGSSGNLVQAGVEFSFFFGSSARLSAKARTGPVVVL